MNHLTYSGNSLIHARLPGGATVYHPEPVLAGIPRHQIPGRVEAAFDNPLEMPPLRDLVDSTSRVLIAFDDNCQPFPLMRRPDFRQLVIEKLLEMLCRCGVQQKNIQLMCAIALHRKMKPLELEYMLGKRVMSEFFPGQLKNFDAEDRQDIVRLGETEAGEPVETSRAVVESDLVIYVDSIQIPLNGGHKAVAVGFGTYASLAPHHSPRMTADSPHVMQPDGSHMHASIERISRVIEQHSRIMVLEAPMNGATYPPPLGFLWKAPQHCNWMERTLRALTPASMKLLPEPVRRHLFRSIRSCYSPLEINAGTIDAVHGRTLQALRRQLQVTAARQFSTLVFGLPDLSPYAIDARINPVLVVSDVLGYVFNWFYNKPFVRKNGVVIILNPTYETFHPDYHVAYRRFWDEVLPVTTDPFQMQKRFQERFATDPYLIDCYRNQYAHHGFHPFTVWYWATYPLRYLSKVILVGPGSRQTADRLGIDFAPSLREALAEAKSVTGDEDVVGLSIPPFLYLNVQEGD